MKMNPEEITAIIKDQIKNYNVDLNVDDVGTVIEIGDGIAHIHGLDKAMAGELLDFGNDIYGLVLNLEQDNVGAVILGGDTEIKEGATVKRTGKIMQVPVGKAMIGRVVDALGRPIDGKGPIKTTETRPVEFKAPGIADRKSVHEPLQTGLKAIDALVPIGRGQRELIIGDHRHHHQPEGPELYLRLCGYRPEGLHGCPCGEDFGRPRRHGVFHRGGSYRF